MSVKIALDRLVENGFSEIKGKRIGLVCNQASINATLDHAVDLFCEEHINGNIELKVLMGPQHGLWGHTQDNMIEWDGFIDQRTNIKVVSLYGEYRKPTREILEELDVLVIDLQDVGSKYYTFIWTMALCMEACTEQNIEVLVLDRPNPLGGERLEGPYRNEEFRSFVGLYPLVICHGMTIGEIAGYLKEHHYPDCRLQVLAMEGWKRNMYFDDTGLPWAMPSPNIPLLETAVVYPGMCLLEGTNLSEGRGTTRPFETFGAPWINSWDLVKALTKYDLPGIVFRPLEFQPTFQKHQSEICGGAFMHVTNRCDFKPFLNGVAILREVIQLYPNQFQWKQPPYEYEYQKLPFDILVGSDWLRKMLEAGTPLKEMESKWEEEAREFEKIRSRHLLY